MTPMPYPPAAVLCRLLGSAVLSLALLGCASTAPRAEDPRDPFEPLNRTSFAVNDGIDRALLRPAAQGYRAVTPSFLQNGIANIFSNAKYPVTLVNNALQGKFHAVLNDAGRLVLNTTFGIGGFFDPATDVGLERYDEDFGQTLGKWGVPPGPYFVVPLYGPTTLRDGLGNLLDGFAEPRSYLDDDRTRYSLWAAGNFERRVRLLDTDALLRRAGDPYTFVRSAYLQRRQYQAQDGEVATEDLDTEPLDDAADSPATGADAPDEAAALPRQQ